MSLKLTKCKFAQRECEWLGHKITPTGITPLVRKTEPIEALTPPRTLSQLKSFMGSIHSLHKYLPALAESSAPLRPLLSKNNEYIWTPECQNAFENLKKQVSNIVELRHFDIHKDIRIVCDASHNVLGAVLEQLGPEGWRPISFASRYLNEAEKKYSTNELEMLAVVWGAEYFRNYILGRSFLIVTDHKALISLLNGNNKKNKTMFSRLTRWLDRIIPFDFQIEHKPGAKIGLADYLSRHPSREATPISTYDNMFTVAKINLIRTALGFNTSKGPNTSKEPTCTADNQHSINRLEVSSQNDSVEGGKTCKRKSTNQIQTRGLSRRLRDIRNGLVGAIIQSEHICSKLSKSNSQNKNLLKSSPQTSKANITMDRSMRKWQKILKQHPSLNSSSDEIEELPPNVSLEAITKETRSIRTNTTLSLPSECKGETVPPVDPNLVCMSIIPRNCKIVNKATSLPDLFNLKFIESNYVSDSQLSAIRDLIVTQDPEIHEKVFQMNRYYAQFVNDFSAKENVVWMDDKLVIPINLQSAINNRIHAYHHGKSNMFDAAKDVWYPYIYRSIASIAEGCPECTAADATDPNVQDMPQPADTNWSVRSDLAYDIKNRTHARRLTVDQSANQDDEPSILRSANPNGQPGPSGLLFQRTGNKNLKRKSGVATKPIPKKSKIAAKSVLPVPLREVKQRAIQTALPPPTPRDVKERLAQRIAKKKRERTGRRFEDTDSESEDSEDLPIISVKRAKQPLTTTPEAPIERSAETLPEAEVGTDQDTIPAQGGELDNQNPREQGISNPGEQSKSITASRKKGASSKKAKLVSYSSQRESQDETSSTTSRKSGRKRTAVTKMGGRND